MRHLQISLPIYSHGETEFWVSLIQLMQLAQKSDILLTIDPVCGDSLPTRARNICESRFFAGEAEAMMFIDSDIEYDPADVLRLFNSGKDICGGVYRKRVPAVDWPCNFAFNGDDCTIDAATGMVLMQDLPTGFMMVRRPVLEAMRKAYPELECTFSPTGNAKGYAFFDSQIDRGIFLSEDFDFCRKAQKAGYQIWADPTIELTHYGRQGFQGALADYFAAQIEGWMTYDELVWLRRTAARMGSIVEIGCWKGRSTYALCSGCRDGMVYAVDHWNGSRDEREGPHKEAVEGDVYSQFRNNLAAFKNLKVARASSLDAAAAIESADMIFIDAGHAYDEVAADLAAWRGKARVLLAGHDYHMPDVKRAVDEAFGEQVKNPVDSIWMVEVGKP